MENNHFWIPTDRQKPESGKLVVMLRLRSPLGRNKQSRKSVLIGYWAAEQGVWITRDLHDVKAMLTQTEIVGWHPIPDTKSWIQPRV